MRIIMATFFLVPFLAFAAPEQTAGVGIALNKSGTEFIKIGSLIPGGPAAETPELKPGIVIRAIFDGKSWIDLKGTSMEKAVGLMRGTPGTQLILKISAADVGSTQDVPLERRVIFFPKAE